jgi:hypothetical protein
MSDRLERIAKLKKEIADLETAEKDKIALTIEHRIANVLHEIFCQWNHTDECGWFYETKWDSPRTWGKGTAHERYLHWSLRLISSVRFHHLPVDAEQTLKMVELVGQTRYDR